MIRANQLVKKIGGRTVLHGIRLEVRRGECLGILGPNGSGKSTLIRVLTGEWEADEGEVLLNGQQLRDLDPLLRARTWAVLTQELTGDVPFTVEELVAMGRHPHLGRWPWLRQKDREIVEEVLRKTGTEGLRHRWFPELSGGEKQRVALARALAQEPEILFLDEPTTYLDVCHQIRLLDLVRRLQREQTMTVVMVLHDLNLAAQYCDRLVLLKDGRIHAAGTPHEVMKTGLLEEVYGVKPLLVSHPSIPVPQVVLTAGSGEGVSC
ncbi:heme ABC transporter ATP-binding protein [Staphylospora marina]|uniref:heme ABC transporter ATP-binding protein n=1 Tax=Staphylospora marina TaxID=2490858 RepID=UPI000F5BD570|nr:heme ABC transporter ATP-binding protein [Staphylospora marina]